MGLQEGKIFLLEGTNVVMTFLVFDVGIHRVLLAGTDGKRTIPRLAKVFSNPPELFKGR
jgi:hypothetical protein